MSGKHHEKPYETDYAKSNRSGCKGCKTPITQGTLRLAIMVQSPFFDGKSPKWFHEECFWKKHRPSAFLDIHNVTSLKHADQEMIKSKILGNGLPELEEKGKKGKKRTTKKEKEAINAKFVNTLNDFTIQYAKSNRSTCRGCEAKIAKDEVRVSKKNYESEQAKMIGGVDEWYHLACFSSVRQDLQFESSGKFIPGFEDLKKSDQELVETTLPVLSGGATKDETDGPSAAKKPKIAMNGFSEDYKKQNEKLVQALADAKKIKKKEISYLCEANNISIPKKFPDIQILVADHLVCGKLKACPKCKGQGKYDFIPDEGYLCKSPLKIDSVKSVKELICEKMLRNPEREEFIIPDDFKKKFPFLESYGNVEKRIFLSSEPAPTTSKSSVSIKSDPSAEPTGPKVERFLPLQNMVFYIHVSAAANAKIKQKLTSSIISLGGDVTSTVKSHMVAAIATEEAVQTMEEGGKGARAMKELQEYGIHVVPAKFLEEAAKGKALELIEKMNMAPWGSDASSRLQEAKEVKLKSQIKSKSAFKSKSGVVKLQIKDGLAVDPDSGLADTAELVKYLGKYLNAVMGKTDLQLGKNSYYKLQVLKSKIHKQKFYLFRSWGRIGTTIGGTKLQTFSCVDDAFSEFEKFFEKETGNVWDEMFVPIPGMMQLLDVTYEEKKAKVKSEASTAKCDLEKAVAALVELLFDEKAMTDTLKEYELDMDRMPLGKLSTKHMKGGYEILNEIIETLDGKVSEDMKDKLILKLTDAFYSNIPHCFGLNNPPLLDSKEMVLQKMDMLDAMTQIELAYTIKSEGSENGIHPIKNCYDKLQADIKSIDTSHEYFNIINQYVHNTHAKTHRQYSLNILDIFEVSRKGEDKRFKPFEKLGNKQLLWHGSRLTNFASIISKGLCIAPPEAPVTGYMFGKGIYFADSVSKSANYCMTTSANNVGLLLLCEVALGNVVEKTQAEFVTKLPAGFHSVQGLGRAVPDPTGSIVLEKNLTVPTGVLMDLPKDKTKNLSLLYNEFIVYDPAQVKIRYILKVRFDYK